MTILVCGVGYIGAALAGQLITVGHDVVGLDNGFSTDRRALDGLRRHGGFELIEGDVAEPDDVRRAFDAASGPEAVVMLAAQASADDTRVDRDYTERTNLRGPRMVFEEAERRGTPRIVFGSSLRVYGQPLPPVVDEASPYGTQRDLSHLSKIYGEKLLEMHAARRDMTAVSLRLPIVYGLAPVMKSDPSFQTVPNRFAWQARSGETLRVAPGVGAIILLHVDDAVRATLFCLEQRARGYWPVNVPGEPLGLEELATIVREEAAAMGWAASVDLPGEARPEAPTIGSRLTERGFALSRSVREGVRELLDFYGASKQ